jgi:8-oxo-dGTP diphosphatase
MARTETCVLTNMCMITDGSRVLVQDRADPNWPGVVFPGGHVEMEESFVDSVIREVKEETGLTVSNVQLCGVKQFSVKEDGYRYIVFLYKTHTFTGELSSSDEGSVFWIERSELSRYPLADGFEDMLAVFENDALTENYHWHDGHAWQCCNK